MFSFFKQFNTVFTSVVPFTTFLFISLFLTYCYKYAVNIVNLHKIPGPKRYPFLGNLLDLSGDDVSVFRNLRKWGKEYFPVYILFAFPYCLINLTGPEEIEKLLSTPTHSTKSKIYEFFRSWLGNGVLTNNDLTEYHQRRKLISSSINFNFLQNFVHVFFKHTNILVKKLEEKMLEDKVINVVPLLDRLAGNIVNGAIARKALKTINDHTTNMIKKKMNEYKTNVNTSSDYKTNFGKKQMIALDLLVMAEHEGKIDLKGIRDEIATLTFGAHDTSSLTLGYALMLLANHKNIQEQVVQELKDLIPDENEKPTIPKLNELKFLERCIKEKLRLFPPDTLPSRTLQEDLITSDGVLIPKGSFVSAAIFDLHRHPKIWPNPEKFDPDRFLPENVQTRHPYAYIPFFAGPRNCLGQKYAMLEIKSVLVGILRKFKLEPVDTPETLELYAHIVLRSKKGVRVKFVKRSFME